MMYAVTFRRRGLPIWGIVLAAMASVPLAVAQEAALKEPNLAIAIEPTEIRAGHLETNARGVAEPLAVPVQVSIQNRTGEALTTSAEITGKDQKHATVKLDRTEDTPNGQVLHLSVFGQRATFEDSDIFLTVTLRQGETEKTRRSVPIRVSVPTLLKLEGEALYDGPAVPGLVHRALNMRTTPKAAVSHPEARLAAMCLHDVPLTVLDQYGDPLPDLFKNAPVMAALGQGDYEMTNRFLREDGSFIDSIGFWQFVGGVDDMTIDPGRAQVQKFLSAPPPPCTEQQYATYEPVLVQYQVGGYPIGAYRRQVTLRSSGDHHKPEMRIVFNPVSDEEIPPPGTK
jgi:hypothetical protein